MVEKTQNRWRIEVPDSQTGGLLASGLLHETEQQPEGVAVAVDRLLACAAMRHHVLSEERLK